MNVTVTVPMPPGVDADLLRDCVLIMNGVELTADDATSLRIVADDEATAREVARDPAGWITRAMRGDN